MKRYFIASLLIAAFLFSDAQSKKANVTVASKISTVAFTGNWKGVENCTNVSSPATAVTITGGGNAKVVITGIYSSKGKIKGTIIKNNTLFISRQQIEDPVFVNFGLEGTLILSENHNLLEGNITVYNNTSQDACTVSYHK